MMRARCGLRGRGLGWAGLVCTLTTLAASASSGHAAPHRPLRPAPQRTVTLRLSPCMAAVLDESELRRLLAIELGTPLRSLPRAPLGTAVGLHLLLDCSDGNPQLADLSLEDADTGSASLRTVDLSRQAQPVRARLLALALAELVQAHVPDSVDAPPPSPRAPSEPPRPPQATSRMQPKVAQAAPSPTAADPARAVSADLAERAAAPLSPAKDAVLPAISSDAATPALPTSQPQPDGLYVQAGLSLLLPFALQPAPLHVGGALRIGGDHRYHLGWDFDAQVQAVRRRTALGELSSDLLSSRVSVQAHVALWALRLRAGLGLRAGAARLGGTPSDAAQTQGDARWAPFGGPLLAGSITLAPASLRRLRIDLSAEGGYLLWSATARVDGKPALAIAGPWLGLSLSLGVSLGQARPQRSVRGESAR